MKYNIIKIFIVGSTSLANRRRDLAELAHKYNINSIRGKKNVKDIIFIYSYEETGSPEQLDYDTIISTEADVVITILEDELGKISYNEAKLALETNIKTNGARPLVYGMRNTEKIHKEVSVDGKVVKVDDLCKELLGENRYFHSYRNDMFRENAWALLEHIISHASDVTNNTEVISWDNDGFAYLTIETRFKENFKIVADNFSDGEFYKYDKFEEDKVYQNQCGNPVNDVIENEILRFLEENDQVGSYSGERSLRSFFRSVPFLLAEYYFYYYLLYLYHEKKNISDRIEDPYRAYKVKHLEDSSGKANFQALLNEFKSAINSPYKRQDKLLIGCLNMNSIDLSQLEVNIKEFKKSNMPINDCRAFDNFINDRLTSNGPSNKDELVAHVITDNCGFELMSDILLGTYLLKNTRLTKVIYHVKRLPIFVSDTIMSDVCDAIDILNTELEGLISYKICDEYLDRQIYMCDSIPDKQISFEVDDCWHQEKLFNDVEHFKTWNKDETCALIIVKGDLNYRRLVGDFHWKSSDPIRNKVSYIEKPLLIIRSLKSNVILDVDNEEKYSYNAPNWKITGQYGIIQWIDPTKNCVRQK